jgi:septum formation protein
MHCRRSAHEEERFRLLQDVCGQFGKQSKPEALRRRRIDAVESEQRPAALLPASARLWSNAVASHSKLRAGVTFGALKTACEGKIGEGHHGSGSTCYEHDARSEDKLGTADMPMLVLASASPRRRELLTQAGFAFSVHPANIPEDPISDEDPIAYVTRLAREKAEAVYQQLSAPSGDSGNNHPDQSLVVLGADTTVTLDGHILGKPEDRADAARMLHMLSGRTHRVITGVAVATSERVEVAAEVTAVRFLSLSDDEIAAYVAGGEPMDKAGAYAIQGRAAKWIPRVEGCYFNVVGLPLALVATMLEAATHRQ